MAPQLLRLHLLEGHSRRNTAFLLPARLYFALFQRFLSPMDSSGCSQRSGDAGGDVVSHGSSACPSLPVPPSDPQRSRDSLRLLLGSLRRSGGHQCGGHRSGGHLPALPPIPRSARSQHPFAVSTGIIYQGKGFIFNPLALSQPFPTACPHPSPMSHPLCLLLVGFHPWLPLAAHGCDPQPGALPQGWPRVVLLPAGVNPLGKQRFPVGSCWECCQGGCTEVKLSPELSSSSVVSARLKCLLGGWEIGIWAFPG